ncbi:hypothetical protein WI67_19630 [Burkholderia cepacia]|nr:hypothetical protein WI67_19630 [Burkholderia cepacia]
MPQPPGEQSVRRTAARQRPAAQPGRAMPELRDHRFDRDRAAQRSAAPRTGATTGSGRRGGMPGATHGAMALPSMRRLPIRCQAVPDTTAGLWRMERDG